MNKAVVATLLLMAASSAGAIEVFLNQAAPIAKVPVLGAFGQGQYPDPSATPANPGIISYKDPVTGQGVSLSGQFVGQTSGTVTVDPPPIYPVSAEILTYETLTGTPTLNASQSLELFDQGFNRNLQIGLFDPSDPSSERILGGLLDTADEAQGAVSLLFDYNVSIFGLDMLGANTAWGNPAVGDPGWVLFQFFGANGELIGSETVRAYDGPIWFRSTDAPFRGISITSTDYQGLGYINLRFEAVPTPPILALLGLGLGLLGLTQRRFR